MSDKWVKKTITETVSADIMIASVGVSGCSKQLSETVSLIVFFYFNYLFYLNFKVRKCLNVDLL